LHEKNIFAICPSDTIGHIFIGYIQASPIFCSDNDSDGLYELVEYAQDSLIMRYLRKSQRAIHNDSIRLIWLNNEIEIYHLLRQNNLIMFRNQRIDTISIVPNSVYDYNYEPFVITEDRKHILAVQPEGYQDENLGWYYDSVAMLDLRTSKCAVTKLPITAKEMQLVGDRLCYKGGRGEYENALLEVKINEWNKIDTLLKHVGFWFSHDSIVYAETGGYVGQDDWIELHGGKVFVAYSLKHQRCAIISDKSPYASDIQPIRFNGAYYNLISCYGVRGEKCQSKLFKINIPITAKFPYKQTLKPQKEMRK
jgi:hypothetical protein